MNETSIFKNLIKYLIPALLIILFITIGTFLFFFYKQNISDDISDWASFSDFFGGIINTILSLITLFVTIYIAIEISKIEDRRNEKNINYEKQQLLRELREIEYKEIRLELLNLLPILMTENRQELNNTIYQVFIRFRYFITSTYHLFPFLDDEEIINLKHTLKEFCDLLEETNQETVDQKKLPLLNKYVEHLDNFNTKMQMFLLNS